MHKSLIFSNDFFLISIQEFRVIYLDESQAIEAETISNHNFKLLKSSFNYTRVFNSKHWDMLESYLCISECKNSIWLKIK